MVCLLDKITNDPKSTKYSIKLLRGNTKVVFHMFLKSSNVPDISSIAIFSDDCISKSKKIKLENFTTSCFHSCYRLCNIKSNPGMKSYLTYILN